MAAAGSPWAYRPVRRPRPADDDFFLEGDALRAKWLRRPALAQWTALLGVQAQDEDAMAVVDATVSSSPPRRFRCGTAGCRMAFADPFSFETHFNTAHRNVCRSCRRVFLSARLLDLHILETHDMLFKVMAERERMYACLVEGCDRKFMTSAKRHMHLVDAHRFPRGFRFDRSKKHPPSDKAAADQMDVDGDAAPARRPPAASTAPAGAPPSAPTSITFGRGVRKAFQMPRQAPPPHPRPPPPAPPPTAAAEPRAPNRRERRQRAREESEAQVKAATPAADNEDRMTA